MGRSKWGRDKKKMKKFINTLLHKEENIIIVNCIINSMETRKNLYISGTSIIAKGSE